MLRVFGPFNGVPSKGGLGEASISRIARRRSLRARYHPSQPRRCQRSCPPIHRRLQHGQRAGRLAAYATGVITIVDEFAPHIWTGPDAAHQWADAYDKHAQATGVTDGRVTYRKPTRTEVDR